jgi:hypothetical protein
MPTRVPASWNLGLAACGQSDVSLAAMTSRPMSGIVEHRHGLCRMRPLRPDGLHGRLLVDDRRPRPLRRTAAAPLERSGRLRTTRASRRSGQRGRRRQCPASSRQPHDVGVSSEFHSAAAPLPAPPCGSTSGSGAAVGRQPRARRRAARHHARRPVGSRRKRSHAAAFAGPGRRAARIRRARRTYPRDVATAAASQEQADATG